jgi:hypothetical protein
VVEKLRVAWIKIRTAGVLRLRATTAVSRDKSIRRSAQDDDFVGGVRKNIPDKLALMGRSPGLAKSKPGQSGRLRFLEKGDYRESQRSVAKGRGIAREGDKSTRP